MFRRIALLVPALLVIGTLRAQSGSYWARFNELAQADDLDGQFDLLTEWRAKAPDDPELYVAWFNHYVMASHSSIVRLGNDPGDSEALQILDPDTNVKEPVGFMYEEDTYDPDLLALAHAYIDSGIARFPQRLDMRFGKVHMYGRVEDHARFTEEIVRTIDHGAGTAYSWLWSKNEPLDDPKDFMYSTVQEYVYQLFETGDDTLLVNMERIASAVLKYEPENVESMTTLASVWLMQGELDPAIELLLKAERLAPDDAIVIGNIAQAYVRKEDKASAIRYYERLIEIGDEDMKVFGREQIEELDK